ncbi:MAG TPA: non-canonical purine NTP pyrophosphatase [Candidatus Microsaccharimonas sp.]|nr:non-canonical purine NTP pyrophosphatase [Candidatus Microsaccharimonas sp.]
MTITLVTGNAGKLAEWQRLVPADFELLSQDVDLDEIQSVDLKTIIVDKAKRAYEVVGSPIIVEDIAAGLVRLNGLPGPFIKFFEQELGLDALHQLCVEPEEPAIIRCIVAYYDGQEIITAQSEVTGSAVTARGKHGFGFDKCFMPAGQSKTYGEMTPAEKDAVSHRSKAVTVLVDKLRAL